MTKYTCQNLQIKALLIVAFIAVSSIRLKAQSYFDKTITLNVSQVPLGNVLSEIEKQGQFYFAYNGILLRKDSLVNLTATNKRVSEVLTGLFQQRYDFEERRNYIIITPKLLRLALVNTDITNDNNNYSISGLVADERTGERLMYASVYDKQQLISTLTDEHGYFRLKLKAGYASTVSITVSKLQYKDTSVNFLQAVSVDSRARIQDYANASKRAPRVEREGLGALLISARQKIQSLNISDFFANRPFQVSLTPGLSTHGMFSPQVVNNFSLNLVGGYTAGVNGLEVGGLFNINKNSSRYLQLAGVFNLVGGNMTGLQLSGGHNRSLDTVRGAQISLFSNRAEAQLSGVQFSALHNETRHLKGVQIGLVNVADTSNGVSIGLLNITHNGFYKLTYSANNLANANVSLKTGTHQFYSSLITSANISANKKFYAFGIGIGHDLMFSDRFYLSLEAAYQFANTGLWDDRWEQAKLLLNVQLAKSISLVAGPTINQYHHSGSWHLPGYLNVTNIPDYPDMATRPAQIKQWLGWEAGVAFNSVFKRTEKKEDRSQAWYLGLAATAGIGWDQPYGLVTGGEISLQRDLGTGITSAFTTGYTHIDVNAQTSYGSGISGIHQNDVNIVPVKAGVRLKVSRHFYLAGDLGVAFATERPYNIIASQDQMQYFAYLRPYKGLMYAVTAGYAFNNSLESGIKFEDYGLQSQYKQFALRLGYRIRLSK